MASIFTLRGVTVFRVFTFLHPYPCHYFLRGDLAIKWVCHLFLPLSDSVLLCPLSDCLAISPSPRSLSLEGNSAAQSTTLTPTVSTVHAHCLFPGNFSLCGGRGPGPLCLSWEGRSSASSQGWLCFLFISEGGWGLRGL